VSILGAVTTLRGPAERDSREHPTLGRVFVSISTCALAAVVTLGALEPATQLLVAVLLASVLAVLAGIWAVRHPRNALLGAWAVTLFQVTLSGVVTAVNPQAGRLLSYVDEPMLVGLVLLFVVWRVSSSDHPPAAWRIVFVPALAILLIGAASTLRSGLSYVSPLGAWYDLKFWLILLLALLVPWRHDDVEWVYQLFRRVGLCVAVTEAIDFVAPHAFRTLLHTGSSGATGLRTGSVQAIFQNPGQLAIFMSLLFAATAAHYVVRRTRGDAFAAIVFLIGAALSLRLKAAIAPVSVAIVLLTLRRGRHGSGRTVGFLLAVGLFAVVSLPLYGSVFTSQATKFISDPNNTPRGQIYAQGLNLAESHFPLGTGFGTFGEDAARVHYSPIYIHLGWANVFGLSPKRPQFLTDTSWPAIYTETGLIGAVIYAGGTLMLLLRSRRAAGHADHDVSTAGAAGAAMMAAYLGGSLGAPALFNSTQTLMVVPFVAMALTLRSDRTGRVDAAAQTPR
jgi:hypothetical protein